MSGFNVLADIEEHCSNEQKEVLITKLDSCELAKRARDASQKDSTQKERLQKAMTVLIDLRSVKIVKNHSFYATNVDANRLLNPSEVVLLQNIRKLILSFKSELNWNALIKEGSDL